MFSGVKYFYVANFKITWQLCKFVVEDHTFSSKICFSSGFYSVLLHLFKFEFKFLNLFQF